MREKRIAWFDVRAFYDALDQIRQELDLFWLDIAAESGVDKTVFTRFKEGHGLSLLNALLLAEWAELDLYNFLRKDPAPEGKPQ